MPTLTAARNAVGLSFFLNGLVFSSWVSRIPDARPCVLATGPLTGDALASELAEVVGAKHLAYYDAIAPVVNVVMLNLAYLVVGVVVVGATVCTVWTVKRARSGMLAGCPRLTVGWEGCGG